MTTKPTVEVTVEYLRYLTELSELNRNGTDTAWIANCTYLVFLMQAGFALIESGTARHKNLTATLIKNTIDIAISTLTWWLCGYAFAFGETSRGAIGTNFFAGHGISTFDQYNNWMFQWSFQGTAATITSGAVIERMNIIGFLIFSSFSTAWIYPLVCHWCWYSEGWLAKLGYLDFAGCGVVHMIGGTAALILAIMIGPRIGRFIDEEQVKEIINERSKKESLETFANLKDDAKAETKPVNKEGNLSKEEMDEIKIKASIPKNIAGRNSSAVSKKDFEVFLLANKDEFKPNFLPFVCLGTFILWFCWYGFNCGSTFQVVGLNKSVLVGKIGMNTSISASIAGMTCFGFYFFLGKYRGSKDLFSLGALCNGILAGLVGITAVCNATPSWGAFIIGFISAFIYIGYSEALQRLKIDDPLDASAIHLGCGSWGLIATGWFHEEQGILFNGGAYLFGIQLLGMVVIFAWTAAHTLIFYYILKYLDLARISREEEIDGHDVFCYGLGQQFDTISGVRLFNNLYSEATKSITGHIVQRKLSDQNVELKVIEEQVDKKET